jgi:hypothetical protein
LTKIIDEPIIFLIIAIWVSNLFFQEEIDLVENCFLMLTD